MPYRNKGMLYNLFYQVFESSSSVFFMYFNKLKVNQNERVYSIWIGVTWISRKWAEKRKQYKIIIV